VVDGVERPVVLSQEDKFMYQGQGHRNKKTWNLIPPTFCDRYGTISLQLQWRNYSDGKSISVIQDMTLPA